VLIYPLIKVGNKLDNFLALPELAAVITTIVEGDGISY